MIRSKLSQNKKWLVLALVLIVAAIAAGIYYTRQTETQAAVEKLAAVARGDIRSTVSATGTISAVDTVDISSRVTGLIKEMKVKENDVVTKGQELVILDDTALRAQLSQYEAQLSNYEATYGRSKRLSAIGAQAASQLDSDRTSYLVAKSTYDNFLSQLEYYVIKSPIDGVVVGTPLPAGQTVAQGISSPQVIMTVANLAKMQIKVLVDESDIGKVKVGQQVSFTVDAYTDKTFTGQVSRISRGATTSSNVVYYPVYVDVDSPEDLLYPSMTARVIINVGESKNALIVPQAAVKEDKGQKYVQVIAGGQRRDQLVTLGRNDDENVEILSGLSEGDQVVLSPTKTSTSTNKDQGPPPPM